jgi:hypothetical protein
MFGRLLIYLGTAWLELRPDELPGSRYHLAAAVVNLTGTSQSMPASWDMALPGPDGVRCTVTARERYLQEGRAIELLREIQAGKQGRILLPWIPLMKGDEIDEIVALWLNLWAGESDERMRGEYVVLARVFLELSPHRDRWRQALEGLEVQKSAYLEEVRKESRAEGFNQGHNEGLHEGLVKGRAQGIVEILHLKFPGKLPSEVAGAIEQTPDLALLNQWMSIALKAATVDQFRSSCGI